MPSSSMLLTSLLTGTLALLPARCGNPATDGPAQNGRSLGADSGSSASPADEPTRMEELPGTSPPIYVLRGHREGSTPIVVLHGMCSHAQGYAQAFQFSAAKKGIVVAPQGDKPCE